MQEIEGGRPLQDVLHMSVLLFQGPARRGQDTVPLQGLETRGGEPPQDDRRRHHNRRIRRKAHEPQYEEAQKDRFLLGCRGVPLREGEGSRSEDHGHDAGPRRGLRRGIHRRRRSETGPRTRGEDPLDHAGTLSRARSDLRALQAAIAAWACGVSRVPRCSVRGPLPLPAICRPCIPCRGTPPIRQA